jgi:hypothetical protein
MTSNRPNPFDSLESAHQYMALLKDALDDAYATVVKDTAVAQKSPGAERRVEALQLVDHKMKRLRQNVEGSLLLLNDLRILRRLLLGKREGGDSEPADDR